MAGRRHVLDGILALDVGSFIAAPTAAMILADFGANVIKVEPPSGDAHRSLTDNPGIPFGDYHWHLDNRGKRSICLDLRRSEGRAVLHRLVQQADVFVCNYVAAVRERLGVTWADLQPFNDRLIYASLTAFGETGSEAGRAGYDSTAYWARSGLMHMIRPDPGRGPARSLPGQGDHPTGVTLFAAVMLALFDRERTGKGGMVRTSLLANGLWSNSFYTQAVFAGATVTSRAHRSRVPNALTNHYMTKDGRWFLLAVFNHEREWENLLKAVDRIDLLGDKRFASPGARATHATALIEILDAAFISKPWSYWQSQSARFRVTLDIVNTLEDLPHDSQAIASGVFVPVDDGRIGAELMVDSPLWIDGYDKAEPVAGPALGAHTDEILTEFGYTDREIATLRAEGAFG